MNLAEIRNKYPQYSDLTDGQLVEGLHKRYYSDLDIEDFSVRVGYQAPPDVIPMESDAGRVQRERQQAAPFWPDIREGAKEVARTGLRGAADVITAQEMAQADIGQELRDFAAKTGIGPGGRPDGLRVDGTPKGRGFLGPLKTSDGKTATELSIGINIDGEEVLIPTLIPTLTDQEKDHLLSGGDVTDAIVKKAVTHAKQRIAKGLSPFKRATEYSKQPLEAAEKLRELAQAESIKEIELPEREGLDRYIHDFARMMPQMMTVLGGSALGTPLTGGTVIGLQIAGGTSEQLEKKGVPRDRAIRLGLANAIMQAPLEALGAGKILSVWKPQKAVIQKIRKIAEATGTEWFTELAQSYPDKLVHLIGENPDAEKLELWEKFTDDFLETTQQGAYEGTLTAPWALLGVGARVQTDVGGKKEEAKPEEKAPEVSPVEAAEKQLADGMMNYMKTIRADLEKQFKPQEEVSAEKVRTEPAKPAPEAEKVEARKAEGAVTREELLGPEKSAKQLIEEGKQIDLEGQITEPTPKPLKEVDKPKKEVLKEVEPKAKEPWEMTADEWFNYKFNKFTKKIQKNIESGEKGFASIKEIRSQTDGEHGRNVKQAIKKGKIDSHPDYPDLKGKPTPEAKKPAVEAVRGVHVEIVTSFQKEKNRLGIKSMFDIKPGTEESKRLGKLRAKQGREVVDAYRKIYPEGAIVLSKMQGDMVKGVIIHKSTKRTGQWQITSWDDRGFFGDTQEKSEEEAVSQEFTHGYRTPAREQFDKIARDPKFLQGIKDVEKAQKEHWERMTGKKKAKPKKPIPSRTRTLRGAIKKIGGINFLNFKGELKEMPTAVKYLSKKTGMPIDIAEQALRDDNWLSEDETLLEVLTNTENLKRDRVTRDVTEKKESELTDKERQFKKDLEHEPEAPPEGEYVTIEADDLPEGKKLTLIEDKTAEGWDVYEVTEKDAFGVTLKNGHTIELKPGDKVQVLKGDLGTKHTEAQKIFDEIKALKGKNKETVRLQMNRGHGWGDSSLEKRRNKIRVLEGKLDQLGYVFRGRAFDKPAELITKEQYEKEISVYQEQKAKLELKGEKPLTPKIAELRAKRRTESAGRQEGLGLWEKAPKDFRLEGEKASKKEAEGFKKVIATVKSESGEAQIIADLSEFGVDLVRKGHDKYTSFRKEMKRQLSEVWDKIKHLIRRIFNSAKQVIANERGAIEIPEKPKKQVVTFEESQQPLTEEDYATNRASNTRIKTIAGQALSTAKGDIKKEVSRLLAPISTRLARISKKLKYKVRQLDFDTATKSAKEIETVLPVLKKTRKMSKDDVSDWDYARKNSDIDKINEIVEKYDMAKEYATARGVLENLRKEAIDAGMEIGEIEEYWPRRLKDHEGFLKAMGIDMSDFNNIYTVAIRDKAIELEMSVSELDADMRANIVSNMILGGYTGMEGVGAAKKRKLDKIPATLNKYYLHSNAAIIEHIYEMRSAIEKRKFFGKIPKKVAEHRRQLYIAQGKIRKFTKEFKETNDDSIRKKRDEWIGTAKEHQAYINKYAKHRDYKANIGVYIDELVVKGEIAPNKEEEVNEILNARFHQRGTHGFFKLYKNLSYMDTMGSPISALTQIGDLAWSMYDAGIISALKYAGRALPPKKYKDIKVTREDVGVAHIAQEFADPGTLGKAVTWTFRLVGLEKIDAIGKESLLNSALERYQKEARANPEKLSDKIRDIFGTETESVIDDLLNDKTTDNVKLLVYNRLLDFQPVALSEMPQRYLTSGNGRIFYMLKTFTIKQFDAFRNEAFHKIKTGNKEEKIQGLKNLIRLSMFFVLANAGADELKDWILGRKTDFSDRVADNILRLGGSSKFITWKARTEGVGSALARQVLPPFKFIDAATKDIYNAGDDKGLEITASIPLLGKLAYWHIGRGTGKREDLWNRRLRKYKARLRKINDQYLRSKDKVAFREKYRKDLTEYRKVNRFQTRLNKYRRRINKLKGRDETPDIRKRIQELESKRTEKIKQFLSK